MVLSANKLFFPGNKKFLEKNIEFLQNDRTYTFEMTGTKAEMCKTFPRPAIHITPNDFGITIDLSDASISKNRLIEIYYNSFSKIQSVSTHLEKDKIIVYIDNTIGDEDRKKILQKLTKCYVTGNKLFNLTQINANPPKNGNGEDSFN